jgi:hypothetical protein
MQKKSNNCFCEIKYNVENVDGQQINQYQESFAAMRESGERSQKIQCVLLFWSVLLFLGFEHLS